MKNLLVSTRPSYQHLLMKVSWALLPHFDYLLIYFLLLKVTEKRYWLFLLSPSCVLPVRAVGWEQTEEDTLDLLCL